MGNSTTLQQQDFVTVMGERCDIITNAFKDLDKNNKDKKMSAVDRYNNACKIINRNNLTFSAAVKASNSNEDRKYLLSLGINDKLYMATKKEFYDTTEDDNDDKLDDYVKTRMSVILNAIRNTNKEETEKIINKFNEDKNLNIFNGIIKAVEEKEAKKKAEEEAKKKAEELKKKTAENENKQPEGKKPEEEKKPEGKKPEVRQDAAAAHGMDFTKFVRNNNPIPPAQPVTPVQIINQPQQNPQVILQHMQKASAEASNSNIDIFKANVVNSEMFFKWHKPRTFTPEQIRNLYDMIVNTEIINAAKRNGALTQPLFFSPSEPPMEAMPTLVEVKLSDYYKYDKKKEKPKYEYAFMLQYPGMDEKHPIVMLVNATTRVINPPTVYHKHE